MARELEKNPWLKIWVAPRATIRSVIEYNPNYRLGVLSWLYGFPILLHAAQNLSLANQLSLGMILIASIVLALVIGFVGITIGSALLFWTGKWIGGVGTFRQVRAAVAWANVPNVVNCLLWILLTLFFGSKLFYSTFAETAFVGYQLGVVTIAFLTQTVVAIWSFIILLKTLGEVQGFSAWKALLNFLIPFVMLVIALWAVAGIIMSFTGPTTT